MAALQPKYKSQWRAGIWLGKRQADQDIVTVNPDECVRCKAVRKTGEHWNGQLILDANVGPCKMKKGVRMKLETKSISPPIFNIPGAKTAKSSGTEDGRDKDRCYKSESKS